MGEKGEAHQYIVKVADMFKRSEYYFKIGYVCACFSSATSLTHLSSRFVSQQLARSA
jgi:hypothetical protein